MGHQRQRGVQTLRGDQRLSRCPHAAKEAPRTMKGCCHVRGVHQDLLRTRCNRKRQPCASHSLWDRKWSEPGHASKSGYPPASRRWGRCREHRRHSSMMQAKQDLDRLMQEALILVVQAPHIKSLEVETGFIEQMRALHWTAWLQQSKVFLGDDGAGEQRSPSRGRNWWVPRSGVCDGQTQDESYTGRGRQMCFL